MPEEPLYFACDGFRLFGVLHLPDGPAIVGGASLPRESSSRVTHHASRLGLVFCPPFAEEHKQGYRVFVELARRLERLGFPSLRFDYRGTGDSSGPFTDFSLAGAVRDIAAAAGLLRQRAAVENIGLVGLRLGASLALQCAECGVRNAESDARGRRHACLVLWQPIVDGALFYRLNIRRMLVRQMMTQGKATGERATGEADTIDLDGFLASRAMCEEIKSLNLAAPTAAPDATRHAARGTPTLLLQFAPTANPSAELRPLLDRLGPQADFKPFVLEPFWDRLGHVDCSAPIEATIAWLAERFPPQP